MKIMTAMYTLKKGGAYDRFIMMVEALLEKGCHVHCLSLTPILIKHPFYTNHVVALPIRIRNGVVTRSMVLFLFPFYLLIMGWREKIDLIVAFGPLYAFLQALAKWVLRKTMITFTRSDLSSRTRTSSQRPWSAFLSKWIDRIGILSSDRVVTNNVATQEEIIRVMGYRKKGQVTVLYNNIPSILQPSQETLSDERRRLGLPNDGKLLVTTGVVTPGKNFESLLRCVVGTGMTNLFLAIVGDGTTRADFLYRDRLKELAEELGIPERVVFTGWVQKEELLRIDSAADLYILPSTSEGMPNALLEALGCGTPCFGSNIPGIRDILCHDELMFDPYDEGALIQKVVRFFADGVYARKIVKLCLEQKEKLCFDWKDRVVERVTEGAGGIEAAEKR
jgi:glycosyltransferase involved in cell wall biosynthesis